MTTPAPKPGQKIKGYAPNGAEITLARYHPGANTSDVTATGKNMTSNQHDALKKAGLLADTRNGGNWEKAMSVLATAGFELYVA